MVDYSRSPQHAKTVRAEALEEACRVRLSADTRRSLRGWCEALASLGSRKDRVDAEGLRIMLDREDALAKLDGKA